MAQTSLVHMTRVAGKSSHAGGGARYSVRTESVRRMPGSNRAEFTRAFRGAAKTNYTSRVLAHQTPYFRKPLRRAARDTIHTQRQQSGNRAAFTAGAATGGAAGHAGGAVVSHPYATYYGTAGAVAAGGIAHDIRRQKKVARERAARKSPRTAAPKTEQALAKALDRSAAASAVLTGLGVGAGVNEAARRHYNRKGAGVPASAPYVHPYRTQYAYAAAGNRGWAERAQRKSEAATNPKTKGHQARRANRYRWSASSNANAAREGGLASATVGSNKTQNLNRYDKNRKYSGPKGTIGIGKADSTMTATQLRHRKRIQAGLSASGATIGLAALGMRGGAAVARRAIKDPARAAQVATSLEHKTNTGLAVGAGVGSIAGFNSAAISRAEGGKKPDHIHLIGKGLRASYRAANTAAQDAADTAAKVKRLVPSRKVAAALGIGTVGAGSGALYAGSYQGTKAGQRRVRKSVDPLVRRYGLAGSPEGVDREKRQAIWDARAKHLNRKRDRWERTQRGSNAVEQGGKVVAGSAGAVLLGQQLRESFKTQHPAQFAAHAATAAEKARGRGRLAEQAVHSAFHGKPGFKTTATAAGATALAGAARQVRVHAAKKTRKYSSAKGGVAAGTVTRMKDYSTIGKSAFGVSDPIAKADRRFNPAPNTKPPLYLARHSPQAAKLNQLKPKVPPAGAAIRNTLRMTTIGKSAFGV